MRWVFGSVSIAVIAAAGMFVALSGSSRKAQPVLPTHGGITVVYPTVRPVAAAPDPSIATRYRKNDPRRRDDSDVARGEEHEPIGWPTSRRIRCAGLVEACFYNGPMGGK